MKFAAMTALTLWVLFSMLDTAPANDMWSETPKLKTVRVPCFAKQPQRLLNPRAKTDLWVETPNLHVEHKSDPEILKKWVFRNKPASVEMYRETPDIGKIPDADGSHPANVVRAKYPKRTTP